MKIIPGTLPTKKLHGYLLSVIGPRPIAFVSTINRKGEANLAPFSFFNIFSAAPPIVIFSPARRVLGNTIKHSLENMMEVPDCVINVVNYGIVQQMNVASSDYPAEVDEFTKAGLTPIASDIVKSPRVLESPAQLECKLVGIQPLGNNPGAGNLIKCEVVKLHINDNILDDDGKVNMQKIDLVGRMGGMNYCRASGNSLFEVDKPSNPLGMGLDQLPSEIRESRFLNGNQLGKLALRHELPSPELINAFNNEEGYSLVAPQASKGDLHKMAADLLDSNETEKAWMLLLRKES